jgi:hypothetical protein
VDIVDISPDGFLSPPPIALMAPLRPGEPNAPELPHSYDNGEVPGAQLMPGAPADHNDVDIIPGRNREQVYDLYGAPGPEEEDLYICNIAKSIDRSSPDLAMHFSHAEQGRQERGSLVLTALQAISCIASSGIEVTATSPPLPETHHYHGILRGSPSTACYTMIRDSGSRPPASFRPLQRPAHAPAC